MILRAVISVAVLVWAGQTNAHLCDNVFRQADKLIVKPETYNLVVKDQTTFKIFLQNNMDRSIAEITLQAESKAFDFEIKPKIMSIPKNQRAFFQVTMKAKPETKTGNYPVNFRLVGEGKVFKTFVMQAAGETGRSDAKELPISSSGSATSPAAKTAAPVAAAQTAVLKAPAISAAPVVDGALDETAWKSAAVLSNFSSSRGGRAVFDTVGLLAYDRQNLYFGFSCNDENPAALNDNDYLEFIIAFNQGGTPAFIFKVSAAGKVVMEKRLSGGRTAEWAGTNIRFALGREGKSWTGEITIPFAALENQTPTAGRKMFIRIVRAKSSGTAEQSYWSAGAGGYNIEKGFGEVLLGPR